MRLNFGVFVFASIFIAIILIPLECSAQAVPPRVQSLQLTKPPAVPEPEVPLQKEIRDLEKDLKATRRDIARKEEVGKTVVFLKELLADAEKKLDCYTNHPLDCEVCEPGQERREKAEARRKYCSNRAKYYQALVENYKREIAAWRGVKK
jgi:hypothetical protein